MILIRFRKDEEKQGKAAPTLVFHRKSEEEGIIKSNNNVGNNVGNNGLALPSFPIYAWLASWPLYISGVVLSGVGSLLQNKAFTTASNAAAIGGLTLSLAAVLSCGGYLAKTLIKSHFTNRLELTKGEREKKEKEATSM